MSSFNPNRDVTINDLEIGALLTQLLLFAPRISPLAQIHMYVNNTASQGWANKGSVSTATSIGPILQELSLAARRQHIHASVGRIPGEENKMADAVSRLTHLLDLKFLSQFRTHFPQSNPWHLLLLPFRCKQQLTTVMQKKAITKGFSATVFKKDSTA